MDLILFPDPEVLVGEYLKAGMAEHGKARPVSTKAPEDMGDRAPYTRVMVTGGNDAGLVLDDAQVIIECYSDSELDAAETASLCRAIIQHMGRAQDSGVHRVNYASRPVNLPDPSGMARYTFTAVLRLTPIRS